MDDQSAALCTAYDICQSLQIATKFHVISLLVEIAMTMRFEWVFGDKKWVLKNIFMHFRNIYIKLFYLNNASN